MKTTITSLGASALIVATLGIATSAQAAPFNLAVDTAAPTQELLHHVGGSRGGRGDGVFGGAFPYSFRHGAFNYGDLGPRLQTLREQKSFAYQKKTHRKRVHRKLRHKRKSY